MIQSHCFTLKHTTLERIIHTPIAMSLPSVNNRFSTRCIWDTGCSNTTITQKVVDALGLKQTGMTKVNTASETNKPTPTFQIDLFLSDDLVFNCLRLIIVGNAFL